MRKLIGFILILLSFFFVFNIKVKAECGFFHGICGGTCTGGTCQVEYVNLNCVCVVPTTAPPPCYKNGRTCSRDDQCCSGYCAETTCATRPVATNTPTSIPCDIDGNNVCNTHNPDCVSTCMRCDPGYVGARKKSGECYTSAACRSNRLGPCYEYENIADWMNCGYCPPNSDPTPTPFCQQYICYEMNTIECPYANFGGCANGIGHCDNCGGVDCGTCSGGATTPVPTQASCTPDCINPTVSSCITTTCYNATCLGNCYQYCYGMMPGDCSCANNLCSTQTCTGTCNETCTGLLSCAPTTLERFEIRRNDGFWSFTDGRSPGRDITDAQNRLQICDSFLSDESPNPRSVVYVAWLNNTNGCGDIDPNSVKMKWLGNNAEIAMTKLASYQSGPCAYTATVTYPTDTNIPSAQGFQITMKSISGGVTTDWTTVTPDLKLKVWNCQVPVSGTLYDGSSGQVCPDGGFTTLGNELGFSSLVFDSSSDDITATITSPSSYAGVNLIWAKSYLPLINGGIPAGNIDGNLQGSNRVTRVTDLGTGQRLCTSSQIDLWNGQVSPYSASPMAQIDFSFIADQEAWYQMVGAGVKSRILLQYGVPVTVLPETSKFLTLGDATRDNGLVSATNFLNINGNNLKDDMGSPNNWYIQQNTNDYDIYNYNYFYNNFYVKAGVGEILTDWSNAEPDNIYFVNGNLNINSNSPVVDPNTQTMIIIVRENITIQSNVTQLDGIYIADGSITAIGDNSAPLTINGMLYAGGSVGLYRSFTDKTVNNTTPAVKVNYSPGLIFNLPPEIMRVLSGWREE